MIGFGSILIAAALLGQPPGDDPPDGGGETGEDPNGGRTSPDATLRLDGPEPKEFAVGHYTKVVAFASNYSKLEWFRRACGKEIPGPTPSFPYMYEIAEATTGSATAVCEVTSNQNPPKTIRESKSYTVLPPDDDKCVVDAHTPNPKQGTGGINAVIFVYTAKGEELGPAFGTQVQERFYSNPSEANPPVWKPGWNGNNGWVPKNMPPAGNGYATLRWEYRPDKNTGVFDTKWVSPTGSGNMPGSKVRQEYLQQVRIWTKNHCGKTTKHPSHWYHIKTRGAGPGFTVDVAGKEPPDAYDGT